MLSPLRSMVTVAIAGILVAPAAVYAGQRRDCTQAFSVPAQSFHRLDQRARHAYVWVDAIRTRLFWSYSPFELYVLVGRAFPPFQAPSGPLDRESFEKIARAAYNTARFGPFRVTTDAVSGNRAVFTFTSGGRQFSLSVLSVSAGPRAHPAVELQLCS